MTLEAQVRTVVPDQQTIEQISNTYFAAVSEEGIDVRYVLQIAEEASKLTKIKVADEAIRVQAANIAYLAFSATVNHCGYLTKKQNSLAKRLRKKVIDYDTARRTSANI